MTLLEGFLQGWHDAGLVELTVILWFALFSAWIAVQGVLTYVCHRLARDWFFLRGWR